MLYGGNLNPTFGGGTDPELVELNKELTERIHQLFVSKNGDYGGSVFETMERYGVVSCFTRIYDKLKRCETLLLGHEDARVLSESVEDTLLDLAGYAVTLDMFLIQKRRREQELEKSNKEET